MKGTNERTTNKPNQTAERLQILRDHCRGDLDVRGSDRPAILECRNSRRDLIAHRAERRVGDCICNRLAG